MDISLKHPQSSLNTWLYLFIALHLLLWTIIPATIRTNLPLDAIEGTIWGHQLQLGYDKNPFLNGWLTALATYLDGQSGWMIYLFSQLSVVICLFAVWKLASKMLPPAYALISVLLLEALQYFNFHAIDFNDNTLELSLWALTIYFFYKALRTSSQSAWILTGIFAGIGMMAKYYTLALLFPMLLFTLTNKQNRKQWRTPAPNFALIIFLLIILPHIIWLFFHHFITITYAFERTSSAPHWTNHFFFPWQFTIQQLEVFIPALILFSLLLIGKRPAFAPLPPSLTHFDRQFLYYVGLGPFLFTLTLSLILGIKLRAGWGMPLLSLWGIMLVATVKPVLSRPKLNRFITVSFLLLFSLATGYALSLIHSNSESSANFPGKEIAQAMTQEWRSNFHTPLTYVAGSRWIGGNIEFYSPDHPSVFMEWNNIKTTWINEADLKRKGAIFVWDISRNKTLPEEVKNRYPRLAQATVREFEWHRNQYHLPPIKIGVAMLPPE